jgi:hypothetical protein
LGPGHETLLTAMGRIRSLDLERGKLSKVHEKAETRPQYMKGAINISLYFFMGFITSDKFTANIAV